MQWKNVYVFISSTFSDMHAERDYLVKNVFPELSEWREARRIRLVDIDLRWGVTRADVSMATVKDYPGLEPYIGKSTVTEMEIEHALVAPIFTPYLIN